MAYTSLFLYFLYCFLNFCFRFIQKIFWHFAGIAPHLEKISSIDQIEVPLETCQLLKILFRHKLVEGDICYGSDFLTIHDCFVNPADLFLSDSNWSLYTLDGTFVYFLRMPQEFQSYTARRAPFFYMTQFSGGVKLARMPWRQFCRFSNEKLSDPKSRVVFYTNAGRSGSTLLTRLLQVNFLYLSN